jgi:hypothetical protein
MLHGQIPNENARRELNTVCFRQTQSNNNWGENKERMQEDRTATQVTVTFLEEDKTQADRVKDGHDAGTEDTAAIVNSLL